MKKRLFILFYTLLLAIISCNNTENKKVDEIYTGKAKIEFLKQEFDFGTLKEGEIVECTFIFKNTGDSPLKITSVDADCGCTVPKYSNEKILPGKKGKIKATFNSEGFRNNIYKTIDVETNADSTITELVITAFIESKLNLN